jgi:hypothetical protein
MARSDVPVAPPESTSYRGAGHDNGSGGTDMPLRPSMASINGPHAPGGLIRHRSSHR